MKREVQIDPQEKNTLKSPCLIRVKGLLLQTGVPKGDCVNETVIVVSNLI